MNTLMDMCTRPEEKPEGYVRMARMGEKIWRSTARLTTRNALATTSNEVGMLSRK